MGYYATGSGGIELKKTCNIPMEYINEGRDAFGYFNYDPQKCFITISCDDKYYEDSVIQFLDHIAPYVVRGEIYYAGDDGSNWRFVFRNGRFDEDYGHTIFDGDPALEISEDEASAFIQEIVSEVLGVAESVYHTEYSYLCRKSAEEKVKEILKSRYVI